MSLPAASFGSMVRCVGEERAAVGRAGAPFDIAVLGLSAPSEADVVAAFAAVGATWWLESLSPLRGSLDELLARVEAGPPAA